MTGPKQRVASRIPSSLARNSAFRLTANVARLLLGLATGVMTARWLGPDDKGSLSTLLFVGHVVLFYVCGLGLGEAATVLVGRGAVSLQRAVSGSIGLLAPACGVGAVCLWPVAARANWS